MQRETLVIRIYLSAPGEDHSVERRLFSELVLPELQKKAASFGFQIEVIDPGTFLLEDRSIARQLREIEACLPFFVAFVGGRVGEPADIPTTFAETYPWIELCAGYSPQEIEIFFAVSQLHAKQSFFYRRDPTFLNEMPAEERGSFLPADGAEATRAAALEERLRMSGRPFLDGYAFRWTARSDAAAALPGLAQHLINDLWPAILEEVTVRLAAQASVDQSQPAKLPRDQALPFHEDVQFTVYRPRVVRPLHWTPLLAFAHLGELPHGGDPRDDPIRQVEQRSQAILGARIQAYAPVTQDSAFALPEAAEVTFMLDLPKFQVKGQNRTFLWVNAVHLEEFQIRAGTDIDGRTVRGSLGVYHGSILLASVRLAIRVDAQASRQSTLDETPASATPFRKIFASYSHKDEPIVLQFERFVEALGDRYLRDVRQLRAGEIWNERLYDFIREADVFQLFWSRNAMTSRFVEQEWRYALSLDRPWFIRPTYWEEPLPTAPELGLPPEELGRIHFHKLGRPLSSPIEEAAPAAKGSFCTECGRFVEMGEACTCGKVVKISPSICASFDPPLKPSSSRRLLSSGIAYITYAILIGFLTTLDTFTANSFGPLGLFLLMLMIVLRDLNQGAFSIARRTSLTKLVDEQTGRPASNSQVIVRNSYYLLLLLLLAFLPMSDCLIALILLFLVLDCVMIVAGPRGRRLGDILAGTQVVHAKR
jgi:uncharacterized RDD family membrane protein YckC